MKQSPSQKKDITQPNAYVHARANKKRSGIAIIKNGAKRARGRESEKDIEEDKLAWRRRNTFSKSLYTARALDVYIVPSSRGAGHQPRARARPADFYTLQFAEIIAAVMLSFRAAPIFRARPDRAGEIVLARMPMRAFFQTAVRLCVCVCAVGRAKLGIGEGFLRER